MKLLFFVILFSALRGFAFVPQGAVILSRTADNGGTGAYTIEQEVQIPTEQDPIVIRETWSVENEHNFKLIAVSNKDQKEIFKRIFIYSGEQKSWLDGAQKITRPVGVDFIEPFHFARSAETLNRLMGHIGLKSIDPVRLSRVGGSVAYAFGVPADNSAPDAPGAWIEQDQFVLRKLRTSSGAEWTGESYSNFSRGLSVPMHQQIRWGNQIVQIHVLSVSGKMAANFAHLEPGLDGGVAQPPLQQEFYQRFR